MYLFFQITTFNTTNDTRTCIEHTNEPCLQRWMASQVNVMFKHSRTLNQKDSYVCPTK